jgi:carboxyl-terminal processing protease
MVLGIKGVIEMTQSVSGRSFLKGNVKKAGKVLATTALALILSISSPAFAIGSQLTEVRDLLESGYVNPVGDSVLNALSIDDMLKQLGDPHTVFFTEQEYQNFLNSMDMTFSGIGVYIDIVPEGVKIISAISGSPAEEAGLKGGDIIVKAAGQNLSGLSQESATGLLRGPDGSTVQITIIRGAELLEFNVQRKAIEVPTVTGERLDGHIGYIRVQSFGQTTPESFERVVRELKEKGVDSWIIDLRDNPGGYLNSALSLAGFFIGDQTAVQTRDRSQRLTPYPGKKQEFVMNEPAMFLTNENSASASEILSAVMKDYRKATILGANTYGKGSVQSLFPLSGGGVLKMTVAKFFSPLGSEINTVGISPDIQIKESDPRRLAELLLDGLKGGQSIGDDQVVMLSRGEHSWDISLDKVRTPEYWPTYAELLRSLSAHSDLRQGSGTNGVNFSEEDWSRKWPLFYPSYRSVNELTELPLDKKFTVRFTAPIDWSTVNDKSLELIESETGARVPLEFEPMSDREVRVIPEAFLAEGKTYWLLTHQGIHGRDGAVLREGALAVAKTAKDVFSRSTLSTAGKAKVQGAEAEAYFAVKPGLYGVPEFKPMPTKEDYGWTIKSRD